MLYITNGQTIKIQNEQSFRRASQRRGHLQPTRRQKVWHTANQPHLKRPFADFDNAERELDPPGRSGKATIGFSFSSAETSPRPTGNYRNNPRAKLTASSLTTFAYVAGRIPQPSPTKLKQITVRAM